MTLNWKGWTRHATCGALLWATLAACSVRLDWPEHTLTVAQRADALASQDHLALVVDQLELLPCDDALASALLPAVYAHGESGPTLLVPHIAQRLGAEAAFIGTLTPPPGRWCSARVLLRAGGDGLLGELSMRGASMAATLDGRALRAAASAERTIPLASPLVLDDEDAVRASLVLVWSLVGVAQAAQEAGEDDVLAGRAALAALLDGARLEVVP